MVRHLVEDWLHSRGYWTQFYPPGPYKRMNKPLISVSIGSWLFLRVAFGWGTGVGVECSPHETLVKIPFLWGYEINMRGQYFGYW
jgi:hypothetical protein